MNTSENDGLVVLAVDDEEPALMELAYLLEQDQRVGTVLRASEVPLSARELTVLSAAAEGAGITEIARLLGLSAGTVRNYMSAITRKTGARNRVDAIRISQGAGWL